MGKNLFYEPTCRSTNDLAADLWLKKGAKEGTTVITSAQTQGRGQRENGWESEAEKNLTFSVILCPSFLRPDRQFDLSIAVSNALYEALCGLLPPGLKVKWPNDLYYKTQKIGGVLIECFLQGNRLNGAVVGIGLNVNQTAFRYKQAGSVRNILKKEINLSVLLENILLSLELNYTTLKNCGSGVLRQRYLANLYRYQEWHAFSDRRAERPRTFYGQIVGISADGQLAIESQGRVSYFRHKEVAFLTDAEAQGDNVEGEN